MNYFRCFFLGYHRHRDLDLILCEKCLPITPHYLDPKKVPIPNGTPSGSSRGTFFASTAFQLWRNRPWKLAQGGLVYTVPYGMLGYSVGYGEGYVRTRVRSVLIGY